MKAVQLWASPDSTDVFTEKVFPNMQRVALVPIPPGVSIWQVRKAIARLTKKGAKA